MIDDDWWWWMMMNDDEWWWMMNDDEWWWWMMMNDDEWWLHPDLIIDIDPIAPRLVRLVDSWQDILIHDSNDSKVSLNNSDVLLR